MAITYGLTGALDIVGNRYPVIKIANQIWMTTNLKTTQYNDGVVIPLVTGNFAWGALSTGAYAEYMSFDVGYGDVYGYLYNWFAVDTGKLAPEGWRVATDLDWQKLEVHLGMSESDAGSNGGAGTAPLRGTNEGSKLASQGDIHPAHDWFDGDLENNSEFGRSGINLLPGGSRTTNGTYANKTELGNFWTTKEDLSPDHAFKRLLAYNHSSIGRYVSDKNDGQSVRCVRDD